MNFDLPRCIITTDEFFFIRLVVQHNEQNPGKTMPVCVHHLLRFAVL